MAGHESTLEFMDTSLSVYMLFFFPLSHSLFYLSHFLSSSFALFFYSHNAFT